MKKNILLLTILFLFNYHSSIGQLTEDYINSYNENYDFNYAPKDIIVSSSGHIYAYILNNDKHAHIHSPKHKTTILADKLIEVVNDKIYFLRKDSLFNFTIEQTIKEKFIDKIKKYRISFNFSYVLTQSDNILIFKEEDLKIKEKISNCKDVLINNNYLISFSTEENTEIHNKNYNIQLPKDDYIFISGFNEFIAVSPKKIYKIKNNIITKIESNINKIILEYNEGIENNRIFFYKDNIYIRSIKTIEAEEKYLLLNENFPFHQIRDLYKNKLFIYTTIIEKINIKSSYLDTIWETTSKENNIDDKNLYLSIKYFDLNENLNINTEIFSFIYNKKIKIDSIVKNYTNYQVSPDGEDIFISTNSNELYLYSISKNEIKTISKNIKFSKDRGDYEFISDANFINLSNNIEKREYYLKTDSSVFIIDSFNNVKNILSKRENLNKISLYNAEIYNDQILVIIDYQTNNSQIYYKKNKKYKLISDNDNFKIPLNEFNETSKINNGFFYLKKNLIIWSETNIKNGTQILTYNIQKEKKDTLKLDYKLKYDSIEYKYLFTKNKKNIPISGGIIYPKKFDSTKLYPLIISIYLRRTPHLHFHKMNGGEFPKLENVLYSNFFDPFYLSHYGYFHAFIDIPIQDHIYSSHSYLINEFIKTEIVKIKNIDIKNIGIIGFSRSAGQVMGALVNDTLIKCALIGNGILSELLDLTTFMAENKRSLITNSENTSRFIRRYDNLEYKSNNKLYDLRNDFNKIKKVDPFFNLNKINTPILFLLNHGDNSISAQNGYFTYLKTKLLAKNTYLINFIDESHKISHSSLEYQKLNLKIHINFLDFYLKEKNEKTKKWIFIIEK